METITIKFDGFSVKTRKGKTVLEAALENGIYLPHLCFHPELKPFGGCRLCVVEINGRVTISCMTPAEEGMEIITESVVLTQIRKTATELMIINHHADCLSCPRDTKCELQKISHYLGIDEERINKLRKITRDLPLDDSNPFFIRDHNRCVLCGICIRTCEEIQGANAIDFTFRGFNTLVGTFADKPIAQSRCESCGECVVRCPVGALYSKNDKVFSREVKTVCPYCGVGCGIYLGVRGREVVSVRGDVENPSNKGRLCVKGRYGFEFINSPERIKKPLLRKGDTLEEATWDEALNYVARKLESYKSDEVAFFTSAKLTNEEAYLIQKFARGVIKTNHIDHCARL